jgi:hypothetical protein
MLGQQPGDRQPAAPGAAVAGNLDHAQIGVGEQGGHLAEGDDSRLAHRAAYPGARGGCSTAASVQQAPAQAFDWREERDQQLRALGWPVPGD